MATTPRADGLQRRKRVRVTMRPNLALTAQQEDGRRCYVLKDPVTLAYFRLDEGQRFVTGLMDGVHTLEDIRQAYEATFRPERLSLEELEAFAAQLLDQGLAQLDSPRAAQALFERSERHRRDVLRSTLLNFLYIKIPLCDPDAFLGRLAVRLGFLFRPYGVLAGLTLVIAALGLIATHWGTFLARLPSYRDFFTLPMLLGLWLALGLAKLLHELGHGLCCKVQGGTVPEMGVLFLVFSPTLYCNVSDSWSLPGKWQRMAVAAAGIYVDLLLASLATFVWWQADPQSFLHNLAFGLVLVCGISTVLWNANPLMRFDGYYLLADWLEVANLAERSGRYLRSVLLGWLGIEVSQPEAAPTRSRRVLFVSYAACSTLYTSLMAFGVAYGLYTALQPRKLGVVGLLLGAAIVVALFGKPVYGVVRFVYRRGGLPEMKLGRLWGACVAVLLILGLGLTIPWPLRVQGQALVLVEPDQVRRLVVPDAGGFVDAVPVHDGQAVRAGDVLAVLSNPKLEIRLRLNEADQALRSQQRSGQLAHLADPDAASDALGGDVQHIDSELDALVREHALLKEEQDRLTLRAPCAGRVMGLHPAELKGKWLEKGAELCRIGDPGRLRAVLLVDPADHRLVQPARPAWLRVHGGGSRCWDADVEDVAQVQAKNIPPQLSRQAGGEILTEPDPVSQLEAPCSPYYLVSVRLHHPDPALHPGVLGRVKIEAAPQTGWWRLHRYLARTFSGSF